MIHHYIQRGHKINDLLELSNVEKMFFIASMNLDIEERNSIIS
jgi:hypothetical protein